jgi:general stress protein YciG
MRPTPSAEKVEVTGPLMPEKRYQRGEQYLTEAINEERGIAENIVEKGGKLSNFGSASEAFNDERA